MYIVRFVQGVLAIELLQKSSPQSVFGLLLQNGAKLIGLVPDAPNESLDPSNAPTTYFGRTQGVMKLLPVPLSHLLLVVGYSTIVLWNHWMNRSSEVLVWEVPIRKTVKADILEIFGLEKNDRDASPDSDSVIIRLVDCCLLQLEPGADKAVLLLLSVAISNTEFRSYKSLWLHTIEVRIPAVGSSAASSETSILHRMLISRNIRFGSDSDQPKIGSLSPSWRVFLTWTDAQFTAGNVFGAQFDVLNQPVLVDLRRSGDSEKGVGIDAFECKHFIDCGIDSSTVLCINVMKGFDGVFALLEGTLILSSGLLVTDNDSRADNTLLSIAPPLPDRDLTLPSSTSATSVANRWSKSFAESARKENILLAQRLLWSICFERVANDLVNLL